MKKSLDVHFSSKTDDWATPQKFFDEVNSKYGPFDLDVCASKENAKCQWFFDEYCDGLKQTWCRFKLDEKGKELERVNVKCWMNPPYGREIGKWVKKAHEEFLSGSFVVALLPARTDTKWFHGYIYKKEGVEVHMLKGRLKFGGAENSAPFPSMLIVFNPEFRMVRRGK